MQLTRTPKSLINILLCSRWSWSRNERTKIDTQLQSIADKSRANYEMMDLNDFPWTVAVGWTRVTTTRPIKRN